MKGEHIVTTIDGIRETEYSVKDDNSWVVRGAAGEYYVLSDDEFRGSYEENSASLIKPNSSPQANRLRRLGFLEYRSTRTVWARKVDEHDMNFFRYGQASSGEAYFVAPWGECQRVEQGDYLVMQYPHKNDEVYRIECAVFESSYANDSDDDNKRRVVLIWTTGIVLVGLAAVVARVRYHL